MIDIHSHILPGIDDGSESLAESLEMAEMAVRSGVRVLTATPHSNQKGYFENYDSKELRDLFLKFKKALNREKIPLTLARGTEIFSSEDAAEKIRSGALVPLNGSRYYLIEFPFDEAPWRIHDRLSDILELGKVPVIAHPERYYCVQDNPNTLYEWRMMGALAQMNKGSIFGKFGPRSGRAAETILRHHMVTCIASDAHKSYARTTDMREISDFLEDHYSEEYRDLLLKGNPRKILTNQPLSGGPYPERVEQKKRWFW